MRRSARMTDSQLKAWESWNELRVVQVPQGETETSIAAGAQVDWDAAFGRHAPVIVEIGSGTGDSLVAMAAAHPEANVVAFEVFQPAVASTLGKLAREGVDNVRIVMADGQQGLERLFSPGQISELWLFFADPWHKSRHHKRRIVQPAWAELVRQKLKVGGVLHMATDWQAYAEHMLEVMSVAPGYKNLAEDNTYVPRPTERPVTKFEKRGERLGHGVWDLKFQRVD